MMVAVSMHRKNYFHAVTIISQVMLYTSLLQLSSDKTSFYDIVDKDMQGNEVKMSSFKGDVLCVVNVASK